MIITIQSSLFLGRFCAVPKNRSETVPSCGDLIAWAEVDSVD
jgi:hypothetical protein